jgi:hypothetical protein
MDFNEACEAKTNFPDANFWVVARGPNIGDVVKHYSAAHIGIRVRPTHTDILLPDYLYYVLMYQKQRGIYASEHRLRPAFFARFTFNATDGRPS